MPRTSGIAWRLAGVVLSFLLPACGDDTNANDTTTTGGGAAGGVGGFGNNGGQGATGGFAGGGGSGGGGSGGGGGLVDPYGTCLGSEACQPDEICNALHAGAVCAQAPCTDPTDCPPAPGGGAEPACFDIGGGPFCGLDCGGGGACPAGMSCFLDMWCTFTPAPAGGGACPDADLGSTVPQTFNGDTQGLFDDVMPILVPIVGANLSEDALVSFTAPATALYAVDVTSAAFDPWLVVLEACGGPVVGESSVDNVGDGTAQMTLSLDVGQAVVIGVEGLDASSGAYSLGITQLGAQIGGLECCSIQAGSGCAVQAIEDCVCAYDTFCCDTQWDGICAHRALECGADCL